MLYGGVVQRGCMINKTVYRPIKTPDLSRSSFDEEIETAVNISSLKTLRSPSDSNISNTCVFIFSSTFVFPCMSRGSLWLWYAFVNKLWAWVWMVENLPTSKMRFLFKFFFCFRRALRAPLQTIISVFRESLTCLKESTMKNIDKSLFKSLTVKLRNKSSSIKYKCKCVVCLLLCYVFIFMFRCLVKAKKRRCCALPAWYSRL